MKKSGTYNNDDLDLNSDSDISDSLTKNTKNYIENKTIFFSFLNSSIAAFCKTEWVKI